VEVRHSAPFVTLPLTSRVCPGTLPLTSLSRGKRSNMAKNDLQGALDLLILKTLSQLDSMHGYGIVMHIRRVTDELLIVEEGSLYPALHRMEQNGWVRASWALTDYGRKAKWYTLTHAGRVQLASREKSWAQVVKGVDAVLRFA